MRNAPWTILFLLVALTALLTTGCDTDDDSTLDDYQPPEDGAYVVPPVTNDPPPWPEWVLSPWVWEDEGTRQSAMDLVDGYIANDIPVGAIIIDSPWETGYNTFEFDPALYPDAGGMVDEFHDKDVRVFLWIVPLINIDSPNYLEAFNSGYFLNQGRTLNWWKGTGSAIDYNNPAALLWWHEQMDLALDLGIDGWKCDMGEARLKEFVVLHTYTGPQTWQEYQATYYRDFFHYTREKLGADRVITARPVDSFGYPGWGDPFAPRDVNFAGWVGDQGPDWQGMRDALINMKLSANEGYVNFGSDIAGYGGDDIREKELFIRWSQLGALCPVMENGGNGEHRPWMYDQQTTDIYRDYARLHLALTPYLYSQGAEAYARGESLMHFLPQGSWHYLLGDDLLVAPVTEPVAGIAVVLPEGRWVDYWTGAVQEGGTSIYTATPLEVFPLYVCEGAIIPMDLLEDAFGADEYAVTAVLYPGPGTDESFDVYEEGGTGARSPRGSRVG